MEPTQSLYKNLWLNYKSELRLAKDYTYIFGNPIKVHIPVDICRNSLMIIGAYPSAHFFTLDGINDVPIEDHYYPFSNEVYFDGIRYRPVKSGEELENLYLKPLELKREQCWITDLVKVFLFKPGHIKKYEALGFKGFKANRHLFKEYAIKSMKFLSQEIEIADPKVIITLGEEVTSIVLNIPLSKSTSKMNGVLESITIKSKEFPIFAAPHPGILMRNSKRSEYWNEVLRDKILPEVKIYLYKSI